MVQPVVAGMEGLNGNATLDLAPDEVLAGYRLIRELGRGGMSVVWLAERADGVVKRVVALKMPMFVLRGAGDVERFARERDALASLSHANVARLYDAGLLPSGQPFIVLEYVDGVTLLEYCERHQLDIQRACGCSCRCSPRSSMRTSTWSSIGISSLPTSWWTTKAR